MAWSDGIRPFFSGLLGRSSRAAGARTYRVFTGAHDEVRGVDDLIRSAPRLVGEVEGRFHETLRLFDRVATTITQIEGSLEPMVHAAICDRLTVEARRHSVVSILVDHSGSMRGQSMVAAWLAVAAVTRILEQARIAYEVLGFTTAGWHGGRSRQDWLRYGRPADPGRLCDLRHIVYSSVGEPFDLRKCVGYALRPDALYENIDGEALAWAAARLRRGDWDRRAILVISDGAPVDDSTLLANEDQRLLLDHLGEVVRQIDDAGDIRLAALKIGDFPNPIGLSEPIDECFIAPMAALALLHHLLHGEALPDWDGLRDHFLATPAREEIRSIVTQFFSPAPRHADP